MIKEYMGYLSGEVAYKILNLFFFYIFVTKLTKPEYALYGLLLANIALFGIFVRFGLHAAINRFFHEKGHNFGLYIGSILFLYIITVSFFFLSSYILFSYIMEVYQKLEVYSYDLVELYYLIIAITAMMFFYDVALNFFNAAKKIKLYNLIRLFSLGGVLLITLFLYHFYQVQLVYAYLYAMLFQYIVIAIFLLRHLYKNYHITLNKVVLKEVIGFSAPLFLHNLAQFFIVHINKLILNDYTDAESVANITFITNVTVIIESLIFVFNTTWLPNFYKYMNENSYIEIQKTIRKALLLFLMLYGLYAINSDLIIRLVSGGKYTDMSFLATVYAISVLFTFAYVYYIQYLFFFKKTTMLLPITLTGAIVGFVLNYYMIIYFGLVGAVVAFVMVKILIAILACLQVRKVFDQAISMSYIGSRIFVMSVIVLSLKLIIFYLGENNYVLLSYFIMFSSSLIMVLIIFKIYGYHKFLYYLQKYRK